MLLYVAFASLALFADRAVDRFMKLKQAMISIAKNLFMIPLKLLLVTHDNSIKHTQLCKQYSFF